MRTRGHLYGIQAAAYWLKHKTWSWWTKPGDDAHDRPGSLLIKDVTCLSSHRGSMGSVASWECWEQVLSLAWHSGLRIQHCFSCGLDLIPGPGTPHALGCPPPKKKWLALASSPFLGKGMVYLGRPLKGIRRVSDSQLINKTTLPFPLLSGYEKKQPASIGVCFPWTSGSFPTVLAVF